MYRVLITILLRDSINLFKNSYYKDYQADSFVWKKDNTVEIKAYVGQDAPIKIDAPNITASRYKMKKGSHIRNIQTDSFYSLYLLNGKINIEGNEITTDTFVRISNAKTLNIETLKDSDLFILQSPTYVDYTLVSEG